MTSLTYVSFESICFDCNVISSGLGQGQAVFLALGPAHDLVKFEPAHH
jgi:hypothetical protein